MCGCVYFDVIVGGVAGCDVWRSWRRGRRTGVGLGGGFVSVACGDDSAVLVSFVVAG